MLIMTVFLAAACIFDYLFHKIPNALTVAMFIASVIYGCVFSGPEYLPGLLCRMILTGAVFYPIFKIGALGAGDVKLLSVCSGFVPGAGSLYFIFFAMVIASAVGVIGLLLRKEFVKRIGRLALYIEKFIKTGKPERYHCSREAAVKSGVTMAGPMLISALMGIGGLY